MSAPTLLVLAAGMGSRYGGLKQMDPVGSVGETILEYSIYDALRAGFGKVVFVIRGDIEQAFREVVGARIEGRVAVEYVFQELGKLPAGFAAPEARMKPWGTTQAVLMAAEAVRGPFAVINADDFYGSEGYRLLTRHFAAGGTDSAMVGFVLRNTLSEFGVVARGICRVGGSGFLEGVEELLQIAKNGGRIRNTDTSGRVTELTGDELVSMNMWGFGPQVFGQLRERFERFLELKGTELKSECYLPSAVNELVAAGQARVKVLRSTDAWFGVTYREDHPRVVESICEMVREGRYPERLWA